MTQRLRIPYFKTLNYSLGFVPLIQGGPLATWFKLPKDETSAIRLEQRWQRPVALEIGFRYRLQ